VGAAAVPEKLRQLLASRFARALGLLVSGTALAHAITALSLPVLTRLYTPEQFATLAVFGALLAVLAVAAALRLELAVPLPESDEDAANVVALALTASGAVALLVLAVVLALPQRIAAWLEQPALAPHLWLLPAGVLLAGCYSTLQLWCVRKREFGLMARTRVSQAVLSNGAQIALGAAGVSAFGLLIGQVLNVGAGSVGMAQRLLRGSLPRAAVSWPRMQAMLSRYRRFPTYSTADALCNAAGIQLPVLVIAMTAAPAEAGYLLLAVTAMQAPMALLGNAIAQVFLAEAPARHRNGELGELTARVVGGLLATGVGPIVFAGFVAPDVFALIFGAEWRRAGELVAWMTPWFALQFLVVPVATTLHVTESQRAALALQAAGLVMRMGAVLVCAALARQWLSEVYVVSGALFYALYLGVVLRQAGVRRAALARYSRRGAWVVGAWAAAGGLAALALPLLTGMWR
jgi:O-antigen/teichoic acid export membrane protein